MEIRLDINNNLLQIDNKRFDLDKLRSFILSHWYPLAVKYRIKPIASSGNLLCTYDWRTILLTAIDGSVIIEEFLKREEVIKPPDKRNDLTQLEMF